MRPLLPLALIVPAALAGCASQQTLDAQAVAARDLDAMKQSLTRLAAAQQDMDTRLAGMESRQTLLANRLDAQGDQPAALDGLRAETAALRAQLDAANAAIGRAQESADDAVKIARDSRRVSGKLADSLLLTENMVSYAYELPELTADGRTALDGLIVGIRPKLPNVFVEIVGYSDNLGLDSQNRRIALERAEAVRRYLHETGGIPLDRMSTISYGDLQPVASNVTAEGRGQNRRIWVRVLR
jgi:outer membrane protein OmpA-like peptidoglycan-associated protein